MVNVQEGPIKYDYDRSGEVDPANYYGFGIVSYFMILKMMIVTFIVLSVVHLPLMNLYSSYSNYDHDFN